MGRVALLELRKALRDEAPRVRQTAASILGLMGDSAAGATEVILTIGSVAYVFLLLSISCAEENIFYEHEFTAATAIAKKSSASIPAQIERGRIRNSRLFQGFRCDVDAD